MCSDPAVKQRATGWVLDRLPRLFVDDAKDFIERPTLRLALRPAGELPGDVVQ